MKAILLFCISVLFYEVGQAQTIITQRLLPANAAASDDLKLVTNIYWPNCGAIYRHSFTRTGNAITVDICLNSGNLAAGCSRNDTVQLGRLPVGTYTVTTIRHLASGANCASAPPYGPSTPFSFTVGVALATQTASDNRQLWPTMLLASESILHVTEVPPLQHISIYDVTGREKVRLDAATLSAHNNILNIPIPSLEPAPYFLRLTDKTGKSSTHRFMTQ